MTTAFKKAELSLINQSNPSKKVRGKKKITTSVKKKFDIQFSSWFISGKLKLIVCHYWIAGCLRKLLQSLSFWFSHMDQYKPILFQFYKYWFSDITSAGEHSSPAILKKNWNLFCKLWFSAKYSILLSEVESIFPDNS